MENQVETKMENEMETTSASSGMSDFLKKRRSRDLLNPKLCTTPPNDLSLDHRLSTHAIAGCK